MMNRSLDQRVVYNVLVSLTDERYLEHDCYMMLERLMTLLRGCYVDGDTWNLTHRIDHVMWLVEQCETLEMNEEGVTMITETVGDAMDAGQCSSQKEIRLYANQNEIRHHTNQNDTKQRITDPRNVKPLLQQVNPKTNQNLLVYLNDLGILPSMFLLRWIRLLLSREVAIEAVFFLWDRLFIWTEPSLPLLDYIAASLLLTLRDSIYACQGIQDALALLQEGRRNVSVRFVWNVSQFLWKVLPLLPLRVDI